MEETKIKCKICGKEETISNYINEKDLKKNHMCFSCNFWKEKVDMKRELSPHRQAIIDGTHYIIDDEDSQSPFRGFNGAKFLIKFHDGTTILTSNLWCQGNIPPYWREQLPDNATFVEGYKWKQIGDLQILTNQKV